MAQTTARHVLHHVRPGISHLTNDNCCVNAAPCRMLARGKSLLNVKNSFSPTGLDHSKNRETVYLDHLHQTGPVSGVDRKFSQMSRMWYTSTYRVQVKPVWELGKPWGGWTLGSTNVEGGLHYPLPVKTRLDNVTENCQLLCTSSQGPRLVRS